MFVEYNETVNLRAKKSPPSALGLHAVEYILCVKGASILIYMVITVYLLAEGKQGRFFGELEMYKIRIFQTSCFCEI